MVFPLKWENPHSEQQYLGRVLSCVVHCGQPCLPVRTGRDTAPAREFIISSCCKHHNYWVIVAVEVIWKPALDTHGTANAKKMEEYGRRNYIFPHFFLVQNYFTTFSTSTKFGFLFVSLYLLYHRHVIRANWCSFVKPVSLFVE